MGRVPWAPEIFNCSAPDTGNMETIERYGTEAQKDQWLEPLLAGKIRSAFLMTEPRVASSDATNIECSIRREGDEYVINGRKWWSSGANDPRCAVYILMGKTNPEADRHEQQAMILVPSIRQGRESAAPLARVRLRRCAARSRGSRSRRRARTGRATCCWVKVAASKSRRDGSAPAVSITACARSASPSARSSSCASACSSRVAFGKPISAQSVWHERIAESRCMIDQARLLVLKAAYMMDTVGNKVAKAEIAMIKVIVPNMTLQDHRLGDSGAWRRRRERGLPARATVGRHSARCASPTARTKCIAARSRSWNCRSIRPKAK